MKAKPDLIGAFALPAGLNLSSGKGVPDAFFKGGMNWKVPGTFQGSKGIFELGINPETNTIYHFLFKH